MGITLEEEFKARKFMHQTAITAGYLMNKYINENSNKSTPILEIIRKADEVSNKEVQEAIKEGKLSELYEKAWQEISEVIPENLNLIHTV